jgi:ribosomal protein L37AE/L43A
MSQHFLLSAAARTLSLGAVARMSDEEAHAKFVEIRWADNGGQPYCPKCGCLKVYAFATRKLWKCAGCHYQFSVTARTIFADRKLPIRDYLLAIAIFANGAKGHAALQLSRDLDCQYKTAYVLAHKLREALGAEIHNPDKPELAGTVAIDGAILAARLSRRIAKLTALIAARPRNRAASARWSWSFARSLVAHCHSSCRGRALRSR